MSDQIFLAYVCITPDAERDQNRKSNAPESGRKADIGGRLKSATRYHLAPQQNCMLGVDVHRWDHSGPSFAIGATKAGLKGRLERHALADGSNTQATKLRHSGNPRQLRPHPSSIQVVIFAIYVVRETGRR